MSFFKKIFSSPVFLAAFFSWFSSQFIKTVIALSSRRVRDFQEVLELLLWRTRKMPSSHSALVVSLATSLGFKYGFDSDFFLIACCYGIIVIRDAVGVRRSSGVQACTINRISASLKEKGIDDVGTVKIVHGHTYLEVFVGSTLGCFIAIAFSVL